MRAEAKRFFASLAQTHDIFVDLLVLRKSYGTAWQKKAESKLVTAEIVVVFDAEACEKSENTSWEIERAKSLGKRIVILSREDINTRNVGEIREAYELSEEFNICFNEDVQDKTQLLELYRIMVESSEQLIQRRQITNGFFITVIGAIIAASGFLVKEEVLGETSILFLTFPLLIGLLMCRSWKNLIDNYGKLNTGKFKVIHKIEQSFDAKIFAAEWVALGKGLRKQKYRSFTSTEQNVPNLFSYLLWSALVLTLILADWAPILEFAKMSSQTIESWLTAFASLFDIGAGSNQTTP